MSRSLSEPELTRRSRLWRWQADLVIVCGAAFVVLTAAAMAAFPGGATYDSAADHYLFLDNYLSDLGATHTYSGRPNSGSRLLFTVALVAVGISLALFGSAWKAWSRKGGDAVLGAIASASAVLGGCFLVAVAFTPWDTDYYRHTGLVRVAFGLILLFVVCLTAIQVRNRASLLWITVNAIYLVALAAYVLVTLDGPSIYTRSGLRFQVTTQKGIVYGTVVNLSLQAWAIRRSAPRTVEMEPARDSTAAEL